MERIKVTLSRKVGPFSIGVWLFVIVAGVALGLLIRRGFAGRANEDTSGSVPDQGTGVDADGFAPGSGISGQGGAPVTITRTELVETVDREVLDDLFGRLDGIAGAIKEIPRTTKVGPDVVVGRPVGKPQLLPTEPKPKPASKPKPKPASKPKPTGTKYTVKSGDTLWKIAGRFGFPHWQPIYDANRQTIGGNPDLIRPGQVLVIPAK